MTDWTDASGSVVAAVNTAADLPEHPDASDGGRLMSRETHRSAPARAAGGGSVHPLGQHLAERAAWSLVWVAVLADGVGAWHVWRSTPDAIAVAPALVLIGLGGLIATWIVVTPRNLVFQWLGFSLVMATVLYPQFIEIHHRSFANTDVSALGEVAARLFSHGHNPYTWSLASASRLMFVPIRTWTYTVTGGHIVRTSYPAGSFLFDALAMKLGFHHMVVDWLDLWAWVATGVLIFCLLPSSLRWLGGLLASSSIFVGTFGAGGTDALFMPFLILAVWQWDRFARKDARAIRWAGPVALGIACTIKQTPWFLVPLLVVGVGMEARYQERPALRVMASYAAVVVGVFLAINLPFIIWSPGPWLKGVMLPFLGGLVASGQGLVVVATHGLTGGANLSLLSDSSILLYLAVVVAFAAWYRSLKRVWVLLVPLVLFLSPRSLPIYLLELIPVAVIAAVTVEGAPALLVREDDSLRTTLAARVRVAGDVALRHAGKLVAPLAIGAMVVAGLALTSHPLRLQVDSVKATPGARFIVAVVVTVHNETGQTVRPYLNVDNGGSVEAFWTADGRTSFSVPPHGSVTVKLRPELPTPVPATKAHWLVNAYTAQPDALTTSAILTWHGKR